MCAEMKFNLIIPVTSAHFWPLRDRENCDALPPVLEAGPFTLNSAVKENENGAGG